MSLIESEYAKALAGSVKRKSNKTKNLKSPKDIKAKAARVASDSSEVMVKITGFGSSSAHAKAHIGYIGRNAQIELENERGEVLQSKDDIENLMKKWSEDFADKGRKQKEVETMQIALQTPEGTRRLVVALGDKTTPEDVKEAINTFAKNTFGENGDYEITTNNPENKKDKRPRMQLSVKRPGAEEWRNDFTGKLRELGADVKNHRANRETMHMVLSMPADTNPEDVRVAVREFAKQTFGKNHEYVMALHHAGNDKDTKQPHVHLSVKTLGFDGKRLDPRKDDLQEWREGFAQNLRKLGVDAEATPRPARGVVQKAEKSVIKHIEQGDKTHKPRVPRVKAEQIKQITDELVAENKGKDVQQKPWEAAIIERQNQIKQAWLNAAKALEKPKPNITINNKELVNERPNYDRIKSGATRAIQRAAFVYQSSVEKLRRKTFANANPSLRNLSSVGVVHDQGQPKVLLQQNALNRLGRGRTANTSLRREGVSDYGDAGRRKLIEGNLSTSEQNKSLAGRIKGFVEAMPSVETKAQQLKRELREKFTKTKIVERPAESKIDSAAEQKKGAEKTAPKGRSKDNER